jgi:asparagine synthase (glutamine-hydrolysing)
MCGIVGIIDKSGVDRNLLMGMCATLIHRGPDASGLWINKKQTVGFAHRRLSIIDLSEAGRQPMSDTEGSVWITFNGEIYNFQVIREELEKKGYLFNSHTDTEVILNSYKEWGKDCIHKFNGMFAFVIYDEKKDIVYIARDRVGKKPLYYSLSNNKFIFASELKALLKDKTFSKEINLQALNSYLTFGFIGEELCIFKEAKKLPPAHAMIYSLKSGESSIWKYWEPSHPSAQIQSEQELLEELESLLQDAVRLRMISDVPLGAFLSGGVDSSLIVAMMAKASDQPIKTFSIGFDEGIYNELPYARIVAKHFKTDHHEIIVKPDAYALIPELVKQFDEPFADSSMIPTYYVSKATRDFVTVALSGDGGDELFGGYSSYLGTLGNHYIDKMVPKVFKRGVAALALTLPDTFKGKRQLLRLQYDAFDAFIDRSSYRFFKEGQKKLLLNYDVRALLDGDSVMKPEIQRRQYLMQNKYDFVSQLMYTDFKTYLPDDILVKVDRASMLVSLEVRAPLLDYRIAEFSFGNIPGNLKVRGITTKYLLKKLARKILPGELDISKKRGFTVPVSEWFRGPLFKELKETLLDDKNCFFNNAYVEKLLNEHKIGIDHSSRLFALLTFSLWRHYYIGRNL